MTEHSFEIDPSERVTMIEKRIACVLRADRIDALDDLYEEDYTSLARMIVLAQVRSTAMRLGLGMAADAVGGGAWWEPYEKFAIRCDVPNDADERRLRAALDL